MPGLNFFVAILIAMAVVAVMGVVIERLAYRPLRNAPRLAALISAIGVSILLQNVAQSIFGSQQVKFPDIPHVHHRCRRAQGLHRRQRGDHLLPWSSSWSSP